MILKLLCTYSLSVGVSQLVVNLSSMIPAIWVRKFMGLSYHPEKYDDAMFGFNHFIKYSTLAVFVSIAITTGFVQATSYVYECIDLKRWLWINFHCNWICFVWVAFVSILTLTIPRQLSSLFGKSERYLKESSNILLIENALGSVAFNSRCRLLTIITNGKSCFNL